MCRLEAQSRGGRDESFGGEDLPLPVEGLHLTRCPRRHLDDEQIAGEAEAGGWRVDLSRDGRPVLELRLQGALKKERQDRFPSLTEERALA